MLDSNDIQKLIKAQKEVFVTKEEFEGLIDIVATKADLENFVTKEDSRNFATKDDLKGIASKKDIQKLSKQLSSLSEDLKINNRLETRMDYIENVLNIPAIKKN
jgi:hypothetical protein